MHAALLLGSIVLVLVCVIGDKVCSLPALQPSKWALVRALSDNATHGVVGGLSWWIVFGIQWPLGTAASRLNQSLWCAFLASALDLDHFVAAGSINIHEVVHLPHRPPLHCSGLCALLFTALLGCSRFYPGMALLPYQWLVAVATHHVRDATRRGLWLIPGLLTTRPLPYGLYLAMEVAAAPLVALILPSGTKMASVLSMKDAMLV